MATTGIAAAVAAVAVSATAAIATSVAAAVPSAVAASITSAVSAAITTAIASPIAAFGLGLGLVELERGQVKRQRLQADGETQGECRNGQCKTSCHEVSFQNV
jgi:hypothetical protein